MTPQNTPVWFDLAEGNIRVNSALGRIKARNMSWAPKWPCRSSTPDNSDRYVQLRGTVTGVRQDDVAAAHIDKLAHKIDSPRPPSRFYYCADSSPNRAQALGESQATRG